ncbi:MAG TPA: nuclear transport factor 2 family protein [Gemmatimonadales bacterium]|nr:nuclear transport factor 2 family protein [Gemmatimonadales bacterium]
MPTSAEASDATRSLGRALVDTFGRGWSSGDTELLMSVFASQAVFIETPFSSPLNGSEAIRSYWQDVPLHQSEISFSSGEIFSVGPWFSAEFRCVFRRRRTGEWVDARGAMFCETNGEKVSEMRMYWHRSPAGQGS